MASHRSGSDIVKVCIAGSAPEPRAEAALRVSDDMAWVDLGFVKQPSRDLQDRLLRAGSGGKLIPSPEQHDAELVWVRWELWSKPDERRRGEFLLGGGDTEVPALRVYVEPGRIFSPEQHQQMVDDITGALLDATWETERSTPGVRVERVAGEQAIAELIERVRQELHDAASVMRAPATELVPARPGERGLLGAQHLTYTMELPENHVVGWWAAHRSRELHRAEIEAQSQLDRRRVELSRISPSVASARWRDVSEGMKEGERVLETVQELRRLVSRWARAEPPRLWMIGPAVTRDPRRRRLLEVLRSSVEASTIAASLLLSRFRERTFAELFEIWGAVAIVQAVRSLGWRPVDAPRVRWIASWSPERIVWSFLREEGERLNIVYEPHAEARPLAPRPPRGPLLERLQRAVASMDPQTEPRLISAKSIASPDYALVLHAGDRVAFAVGDAIASDFKWLKRSGKSDPWEQVRIKLTKLSTEYAPNIAWWSPGAITTCSAPASFVLVPGDGERWLAEKSLADEADLRNVLLLGALPRGLQEGEHIDSARVEGIIETLRAHARDGSHQMPLTPGAGV